MNPDFEEFLRAFQIPFIGRSALIINKRETGRLKDRADLEAMGEDDS